jgi:hypothetical protein
MTEYVENCFAPYWWQIKGENMSIHFNRSVVPIPVLLIVFMVLMITTVSLAEETAAPDSSGVAIPGSNWGALPEITETTQAAADEKEKKKRVPKKEAPKKTEEERTSYYDDDDDDDDDGTDDCIGGCIGGILAGIFSSSDKQEDKSSEQEEYTYEPAQSTTQHDDEPTQEKQKELFKPAGFRLGLDLSLWGFSGPSDLMDEYKEFEGGRYALSGYFNMSGTFEIEVDAGYSHIKGRPLFDYETSTKLESPQSSHIQMFDTGVRFGMIHVFSPGGPILRWGLGPRAFWVKETADLEVYSLPDETYLGDKEETLEDWRLGGDVVVSMLWDVGRDFLIGFSTRFFVIPWESSYMKSLTLDHIGKKSVTGWNVGFAVHFNGL